VLKCAVAQQTVNLSGIMALMRNLCGRVLIQYGSPGGLGAALYHKNVIDHYENPRNVGSLDKSDQAVGTGLVGAPACGDVMKLQIKVDENGKIIDAKFKTFGCGSAIASSSLATEWIKGKTLSEAGEIKNTEIAKELSLPPVKLHCSMLAQDAIRAALADYKLKNQPASSQ
jgi:Fe-S cluster assembly scaffold IscU